MNSNKTRRHLMFGALALGLAAGAQAWTWNLGSGERVDGNGEMGSETRSLGAFEAIRLSGNFKLKVRQAGGDTLEISADKNLLPYIETRVVESKGGLKTLEIAPKNGYRLSSRQPVQVHVGMIVLRRLALDGSGDARVEGMKTPRLEVAVAGSGDVLLSELFSEEASFSVAGSGDIQAQGRVNALKVSVAGSGDVKAADLAADEVRVSVAGSGDVLVQANKQLKASIAGSGDVRYRGTPQISSSVAGSGSILPMSR
jgi:hypothetical protein